MPDTLENDLATAITADLHNRPPLNGPSRPVERRPPRPVPVEPETPRRATEQLAVALAGLLKAESDLQALTEELVGPYKEPERDLPGAMVEGLPMFDRVRNDARSLAELALRIDKRIQFIREKL
jgi:hypothetical protein